MMGSGVQTILLQNFHKKSMKTKCLDMLTVNIWDTEKKLITMGEISNYKPIVFKNTLSEKIQNPQAS